MKLAKDAYTVGAIVDALQITATRAMQLVADGPRAVPMRARVSVGGRKRTKEPTSVYVWGPDALALLHDEQALAKARHTRAWAQPEGACQ